MSEEHSVMAAEIERHRERAVRAEHDRNESWKRIRQLEHERDALLAKLKVLETASWAESVQGEAAWKGRAEVAELALVKKMGENAAMRQALETIGGSNLRSARSGIDMKAIADRAIIPNAGKPEADVIASAIAIFGNVDAHAALGDGNRLIMHVRDLLKFRGEDGREIG